MPLGVFELKEASVKNDGIEHVENVGRVDGLPGERCKVASISEIGHEKLEALYCVPRLLHLVTVDFNFPLVAVAK